MRIAVVYSGRVQGVGFRATTRDLALHLPVTGSVRNLPDGTVRLEAQGPEADVQRLLGRIDEALGRFIHARHLHNLPESSGETGFTIAR